MDNAGSERENGNFAPSVSTPTPPESRTRRVRAAALGGVFQGLRQLQ